MTAPARPASGSNIEGSPSPVRSSEQNAPSLAQRQESKRAQAKAQEAQRIAKLHGPEAAFQQLKKNESQRIEQDEVRLLVTDRVNWWRKLSRQDARFVRKNRAAVGSELNVIISQIRQEMNPPLSPHEPLPARLNAVARQRAIDLVRDNQSADQKGEDEFDNRVRWQAMSSNEARNKIAGDMAEFTQKQGRAPTAREQADIRDKVTNPINTKYKEIYKSDEFIYALQQRLGGKRADTVPIDQLHLAQDLAFRDVRDRQQQQQQEEQQNTQEAEIRNILDSPQYAKAYARLSLRAKPGDEARIQRQAVAEARSAIAKQKREQPEAVDLADQTEEDQSPAAIAQSRVNDLREQIRALEEKIADDGLEGNEGQLTKLQGELLVALKERHQAGKGEANPEANSLRQEWKGKSEDEIKNKLQELAQIGEEKMTEEQKSLWSLLKDLLLEVVLSGFQAAGASGTESIKIPQT